MRRIVLATQERDGSGRVFLDRLGIVGNVEWGTMFPGGASALTATLALDPSSGHPALRPGRVLRAHVGGAVPFTGVLQSPQRGDPWRLTAIGLGSLANQYRAYAVATSLSNVNALVDAAIARGLAWSRPASLGTGGNGATANGAMSLAEALTSAAIYQSKAWQVAASGVVSMVSFPASATHLLASTVLPPTTMDNWYTYAVGWDGASTSTYTNTAAEARFGHVEGYADLTQYGSSSASVVLPTIAALNAPRPQFRTAFPLSQGQLRVIGGGAVDLATVTAGIKVRLMVVDPTRLAESSAVQSVELLIAETHYRADTETLDLTPDGTSRDDFLALIAKAVA